MGTKFTHHATIIHELQMLVKYHCCFPYGVNFTAIGKAALYTRASKDKFYLTIVNKIVDLI